MGLTDAYVQTQGQLPELFRQIRQGQAPKQVTFQHLKDLGFTSSNHRLFIPLLKALGFLTPDGQPTQRYHEYRDESQSKRIMAEAIRDAYSDLFVLRSHPGEKDKTLIEGKFKSTHNTSDRMAKLMASTFYSLLPLADLDAAKTQRPQALADVSDEKNEIPPPRLNKRTLDDANRADRPQTSLHYNIQIHLPATKDIEVYNAIFKSLKEHLLE